MINTEVASTVAGHYAKSALLPTADRGGLGQTHLEWLVHRFTRICPQCVYKGPWVMFYCLIMKLLLLCPEHFIPWVALDVSVRSPLCK